MKKLRPPPRIAGLSDFITENSKTIVDECEAFARTLLPAAANMDQAALRDHLAQILTAAAADMKLPQTKEEQAQKSKGHSPPDPMAAQTDAETHGSARAASGFAVVQTAAEYRALRASVIRLWLRTSPHLGPTQVEELTRFNEAMDQALAESLFEFAKAAARDRNLLLGVLSHELRTPLGTIVVSAHALLKAAEQQQVLPEAATRVLRGSARIESLLNELLDYVRSGTSGGLRIKPMDLRMDELCERLARELEATFPGSRVEVHTDGDMAGVWDEFRIAQAVSNLISNAIKYGPPGALVRVHVEGAAEDEVVVAVHNAGPEIPTELKASLFRPLVRGAGPDKSGVSLGLGLYIVREIATAHGGTVEVTSSAQDGTVLSIRLPRASDTTRPSAFGNLGMH